MNDVGNVSLNFVESFEDVTAFFQWLSADRNRNFLGFDCETTGLSHVKDRLRMFQFGDVDTGWAFDSTRWLGVAEQVFRTYTGKLVGHNAPFDVRFLARNGVKVPWAQVHDTRNMSHIIDPSKSTALKARTSTMLSPAAKRLQSTLAGAMKEQGWTWETVPMDFDIYHMYGAFDPVLTCRLAEAYEPLIQAEFQEVYDLEMQVSRVCSNMEERGIKIDLTYCDQKHRELLEYCRETERWCVENYGVRPSETQSVAIALHNAGVDLSKTTATGLWSMDKDVLEGIDHPLAEAVLGHRKATKINSAYFSNFLKMHTDSVLHTSINTLAAKTARMSTNNPALQTIPRGPVVRSAFIPFPGEKLYSVDYSGVEARLFAHFANEEDLIKVFLEGFDPHAYTAQQVFGVETPTKAQRQIAKNCTFCLLYGGGPDKMALTGGISFDEAQQFLDAYKVRFKGVEVFMNSVDKVARQRLAQEGKAYVKTPIGRRQIGEKDKIYALVNFLIQGTAGDVLKRALVDLDMAGFGPYMCLPIHDEILFSMPETIDIQEIVEVMEDRTSFRVPLLCEAAGPLDKWGDKA